MAKKAKFEKFDEKWGAWDGKRHSFYFRLKAPNGRIICQSEGYNSKRARDNGIAAIKKYAADAEVVDV